MSNNGVAVCFSGCYHHFVSGFKVTRLDILLIPFVILVIGSFYRLGYTFQLGFFLFLGKHIIGKISQQIFAIDKRNYLWYNAGVS